MNSVQYFGIIWCVVIGLYFLTFWILFTIHQKYFPLLQRFPILLHCITFILFTLALQNAIVLVYYDPEIEFISSSFNCVIYRWITWIGIPLYLLM